MDEDSYNFLHGYPTDANITFWYHRREDETFEHNCALCEYKPYHIRSYWDAWPAAEQFECLDCWTERKRRARVLRLDAHWEQDSRRMADPHFAEAVLITQYNIAVFYFAQQRALNFVKHSRAPSFWIQATDSPPNWYANGYTKNELLEQKKKWLTYHARKTDGDLVKSGVS